MSVSMLRVGGCVWCEGVYGPMFWEASHGNGILCSQEAVTLSHGVAG